MSLWIAVHDVNDDPYRPFACVLYRRAVVVSADQTLAIEILSATGSDLLRAVGDEIERLQWGGTTSVEGTPVAELRTPGELTAIPGKPRLQVIPTIKTSDGCLLPQSADYLAWRIVRTFKLVPKLWQRLLHG